MEPNGVGHGVVNVHPVRGNSRTVMDVSCVWRRIGMCPRGIHDCIRAPNERIEEWQKRNRIASHDAILQFGCAIDPRTIVGNQVIGGDWHLAEVVQRKVFTTPLLSEAKSDRNSEQFTKKKSRCQRGGVRGVANQNATTERTNPANQMMLQRRSRGLA